MKQYKRGAPIFPPISVSSKPLDEAPELRWAVEKALAKRRVMAICFDETQHLMANGEEVRSTNE